MQKQSWYFRYYLQHGLSSRATFPSKMKEGRQKSSFAALLNQFLPTVQTSKLTFCKIYKFDIKCCVVHAITMSLQIIWSKEWYSGRCKLICFFALCFKLCMISFPDATIIIGDGRSHIGVLNQIVTISDCFRKMAAEDFCLKWNDHHSVFFSVAEELLRQVKQCYYYKCYLAGDPVWREYVHLLIWIWYYLQGTLADVTLATNKTTFLAHRLVLSACSSFFSRF